MSENTIVRHNVGSCPACRDYLWADVEIEVTVANPTMSAEGRPHVYASARAVAMSVEHACFSDEDFQP